MKVIEFLGMPRTGKTTQIQLLQEYLKENGYSVHVVSDRDRAEKIATPPTEIIGYKLVFFSEVIEEYFRQLNTVDVFIIDRGWNDSLAWFTAERILGNITQEREKQLQDTFREYMPLVDKGLCLMTSPTLSIERHEGTEQMAVDDFAMNNTYLTALEKAYTLNKDAFVNTEFIETAGSIEEIHKLIIQRTEPIL